MNMIRSFFPGKDQRGNTRSFSTMLIFTIILCYTQLVAGQSPQANIDQGNNGSFPGNTNNPVTWVNGNLNESQNHYLEGQSIPYRAILNRIKTGCPVKIRIGFDVRRNGKMAIDFLTSNDWAGPHQQVFGHQAENVRALSGLSGIPNTPSYFTLPSPGSVNTPVSGQPAIRYNAINTAGQAKMAIYNGSISNITWVTMPNYSEANSSDEAIIEVTLTATALPVVLSWGGHIASRFDWGYVNGIARSAGGISGSPYHMRLIEWTQYTPANSSNCNPTNASMGNQDRSMQISAPPCQGLSATATLNMANYDVNNSISLSAVPSGGYPPYEFSWTSSTPNVIINDPTTPTPMATVIGTASTVTFTVVIKDILGCLVTRTLTQALTPRSCGINGPGEACPNDLQSFSFPFSAAGSVSWSVSGNGSISGPNNMSMVSIASSNVCGGSYVVSVTAVYPNETVTCSKLVTLKTPGISSFVNEPGNITVDCGNIPAPSVVNYTNFAAGGCLVSGAVTAIQTATPGLCGGLITETWTYTDICNRTISGSRTITVNRTPAASFTNEPSNITVDCGNIPAPYLINYSNGKDEGCLISGSVTAVQTSAPGICGGTVTESWTFTDDCSRTIEGSRLIVVNAAAPASFENEPVNITVAYDNIPSPAVVNYDNNSQLGCRISGSVTAIQSQAPGICGGLITETWSFTDDCGRTITGSRTITVQAVMAASFINAPENITATVCGIAPVPSALYYTNNQSGAEEISGSVLSVVTGGTANNCGDYTETWTFTDDCGRTITHSRLITVPCCQNNNTEGCSPGFWKNHESIWDQLTDRVVSQMPAGLKFTKETNFFTYFNINPGTCDLPSSLTMKGALELQGGNCKAFSRHAVSALLNAAAGLDIPYPAGTTDFTSLKNLIQSALSTCSCGGSLFSSLENISAQYCPLCGCEDDEHGSGDDDGEGENMNKRAPNLSSEKSPIQDFHTFPNPFRNEMTFSFVVSVSGKISLELYDMNGKKIETVYSGFAIAGEAFTLRYRPVVPYAGLLVYKLKAGDRLFTGKIFRTIK